MSRFAAMLEEFFYRPDEDIGPWFDVASPGEEPVRSAQLAQPSEYLAFKLEGECFALPVHQVREIVKVRVLTELPGAGPGTLGIINLRGEMMPVYDIRARLHLGGAPLRIAGPEANLASLRKAARILIVHGNDEDAGWVVDQVTAVASLRPSDIEPRSRRETDAECVIGVARWEGQVLLLLDSREMLS